jgi:hypothetical protein
MPKPHGRPRQNGSRGHPGRPKRHTNRARDTRACRNFGAGGRRRAKRPIGRAAGICDAGSHGKSHKPGKYKWPLKGCHDRRFPSPGQISKGEHRPDPSVSYREETQCSSHRSAAITKPILAANCTPRCPRPPTPRMAATSPSRAPLLRSALKVCDPGSPSALRYRLARLVELLGVHQDRLRQCF